MKAEVNYCLFPLPAGSSAPKIPAAPLPRGQNFHEKEQLGWNRLC